jgi:hypothetical protein
MIFIYSLTGKTTRGNGRSEDTIDGIDRTIHDVCRHVLKLSDEYIKPPTATSPPQIRYNTKIYPYFKDCIGAIDGTILYTYVLIGMHLLWIFSEVWEKVAKLLQVV